MSFNFTSWFDALGLPQYKAAFESNAMTEKDVIASISDADLKDIGVSVLGHRKKILLEAEKLKGSATPAAAPAAAVAPAALVASAAASKVPAAAAPVSWPPESEIRRAEWPYAGTGAPFLKGRYNFLYQGFWCALDLKGSPLQCISIDHDQPGAGRFEVYSADAGGVTRRIPLDFKKWLGSDDGVIRGFDLLDDHVMVAWGTCDYSNTGSTISVWDPMTGFKAGYKKPTDAGGEYSRGCVVDQSRVFVTQGDSLVLYNYEKAFVERTVAKVSTNCDITWVQPRNRTATGPNTVMTGNGSAVVDIWDFRDKCTVPSRSIPIGLDTIKQFNWHPSNPDTLVACAGFNNGVHEIKVVSLSTGGEITTLKHNMNKCTAVGIYGQTVVAGCGSLKFFKLNEGVEPIGELEHATVSCFDLLNMQLYRDRALFACQDSNNNNICCMKY